jgi:hypothetical protein
MHPKFSSTSIAESWDSAGDSRWLTSVFTSGVQRAPAYGLAGSGLPTPNIGGEAGREPSWICYHPDLSFNRPPSLTRVEAREGTSSGVESIRLRLFREQRAIMSRTFWAERAQLSSVRIGVDSAFLASGRTALLCLDRDLLHL